MLAFGFCYYRIENRPRTHRSENSKRTSARGGKKRDFEKYFTVNATSVGWKKISDIRRVPFNRQREQNKKKKPLRRPWKHGRH